MVSKYGREKDVQHAGESMTLMLMTSDSHGVILGSPLTNVGWDCELRHYHLAIYHEAILIAAHHYCACTISNKKRLNALTQVEDHADVDNTQGHAETDRNVVSD